MPPLPLKCSLEMHLLSMGPRSYTQFRAAMKQFDVCDVPGYAEQTETGVMHTVHVVATRLYESNSDAVLIDDLFPTGAAELPRLFLDQMQTPFMKKCVQLLPDGRHVRGSSPFGIFDVASLVAFVKSRGICGTSRSQLCGEYPAAFVDLNTCLQSSVFVATPKYVWHTSQVTKNDETSKEKWYNKLRV